MRLHPASQAALTGSIVKLFANFHHHLDCVLDALAGVFDGRRHLDEEFSSSGLPSTQAFIVLRIGYSLMRSCFIEKSLGGYT